MDVQLLIEKLRKLEALFAGAASDGERGAAANAIDKIKDRLKHAPASDPAVEYRFSMNDMWNRKLFVALLRRYGLQAYRYSGQRYTTVMTRVPRSFVDDTLWPEYLELSNVLITYLEDVTNRVISESIFADSSEVEVRSVPAGLPAPRE